jgi:alpha-glucosidase
MTVTQAPPATQQISHLLDRPHHDGGPVHVPADVPALGDRVPVRVRVPAAAAARLGDDGVVVRVVQDGEPMYAVARPDGSDGADAWYVAEVEVHNPVTRYRFLVDHPGGARWLTARGPVGHDVPDDGDFRLTTFGRAPQWARHGAVYQVFPDRFARSAAADGRPVPDWAVPMPWDAEPAAHGAVTGQQLYGGDLAGIEERLDHLERLGVDVLYLTPIFPARSAHRYDAATFDAVDPLLGGDAALTSLADAVHRRGMRLVADLTTNHTGVTHEWFERAQSDPTSPEARFYLRDGAGYVGWLGHATLPKLDHTSPELRRRLLEGPASVVGRWLRPPFDLDGWRVDVANMTGRYRDANLTRPVARAMRATVEQARPDGVLIGEHFHDATADLAGDGWHGVMNYSGFARPLWGWLAPDGWRLPEIPVPLPRRTGAATVAAMVEYASRVPWSVTAQQWNLLGSHDTARIRTRLGDPALVEVAAGLLATYPGTPMVFAGDEVGATGTTGEHARVTMPWDRPDRRDERTFAAYRALLGLRRGSAALRDGGLRWVLASDDAIGYLREVPGERVLVVAARAPWPGLDLPRHLAPSGDVETLYGPELQAGADGLRVPGEGPGVGVWRLG